MLILRLVFFPRNASVREIVLQNKNMRIGGYPVGWGRSGLWGLFFVVCQKNHIVACLLEVCGALHGGVPFHFALSHWKQRVGNFLLGKRLIPQFLESSLGWYHTNKGFTRARQNSPHGFIWYTSDAVTWRTKVAYIHFNSSLLLQYLWMLSSHYVL